MMIQQSGKFRIDDLVPLYRVKSRRQKEIKPFKDTCHIFALILWHFFNYYDILLGGVGTVCNIVNDIIQLEECCECKTTG